MGLPFFKLADGINVYYEQYGPKEGFNLVFIHGWGVSSVWFSEIIPYIMNNGYRITIFDFPGHGRYSDRRKHGYTYDQMKTDFIDILKNVNLKLKPIGLLGWSAGAGIIQRFYTEPELKSNIKCLILIGGSYSVIDDPISKSLWSSLVLPINLGLSPLLIFGKNRLIRTIAPLVAIYWKKPIKNVLLWLQDLLLLNRDVMIKELRELLKYNLKDKLSEIEVPTLIIAGKNDMITPIKIQNTMHELIPNSELQLINNVGHMVLVTHSDEINPIIVEFLKKHSFCLKR